MKRVIPWQGVGGSKTVGMPGNNKLYGPKKHADLDPAYKGHGKKVNPASGTARAPSNKAKAPGTHR